MFRKLFPLVVVSLWGVVVMSPSQPASASTPLTQAVVKSLRNWVQLMPQSRPKRRAQITDAMTPGDGLSTGKASLVDLRFNDGSLARIGERAVFRFVPRSRTFTLSNGTVLLLIPPGRGETKVRTRSAAATIRGSALFVRYDQQTDTTVVGSLTDSGIEVFNQDESRSRVLKAGQLIVLVKGEIQGLYNFDLRSFYDTSDLVRGLDLTKPNNTPSSDPAMASVQAETSEALSKQLPITGENVVENPSFIQLSPAVSSDVPGEEVVQDALPVNSLVDTGEILLNNTEESEDKPIPQTPTNPPVNNNKPIPQTPVNRPVNNDKPIPQTPSNPPVNNDKPIPQTPSNPPVNNDKPIPQTPSNPPVNNDKPIPQTPVNPPVNNDKPQPQTPVNPPVNNDKPTIPTPEPTIPTPEPQTP
ncbi:MAG: FecR domain-containing protein, partial [Rivularia sp. T60_A2020_040]|nr:FecR domain-containing protein [Rivularia sp. T60_A2020_040]